MHFFQSNFWLKSSCVGVKGKAVIKAVIVLPTSHISITQGSHHTQKCTGIRGGTTIHGNNSIKSATHNFHKKVTFWCATFQILHGQCWLCPDLAPVPLPSMCRRTLQTDLPAIHQLSKGWSTRPVQSYLTTSTTFFLPSWVKFIPSLENWQHINIHNFPDKW